MNRNTFYKWFNYTLAVLWIANGLFCKVKNFVPRHREIVARILGDAYAAELTRLIGVLEIGMAIWILSGWYRKLNVASQIVIIIVMNVLELAFANDLLLWGRLNLLFAILFSCSIYLNEHLKNRIRIV